MLQDLTSQSEIVIDSGGLTDPSSDTDSDDSDANISIGIRYVAYLTYILLMK